MGKRCPAALPRRAGRRNRRSRRAPRRGRAKEATCMTTPPDLLLPVRAGLPADIAYLRAGWPAPSWRGHGNFGELSAFWLQVHASLREQSEALRQVMAAFRERRTDPASFQRLFVPRLNHFLQHLNGHHQIEDAAYFNSARSTRAWRPGSTCWRATMSSSMTR